jgi:hypothetical protein
MRYSNEYLAEVPMTFPTTFLMTFPITFASKRLAAVLAVVILALLAGCATTVERVETEEVIDLSGAWNDTDSRLVATKIIEQALGERWLRKWKEGSGGRPPVVIVGTVRNLSHEHISIKTFVKDIERALINSGEVEFVASKGEREEVREERRDQASSASEETAKAAGEELGADFLLRGDLTSIVDRVKGKQVIFYQVNMELINIETNKKVWIGEEKIKKFLSRGRLGM